MIDLITNAICIVIGISFLAIIFAGIIATMKDGKY